MHLATIFLLSITALSSNALSIDDNPDFYVDVDTLKSTAGLYFGRIYDRKNFEEKGGAFRELHNLSWQHEKGQFITFSKTAFILPINAEHFIEQQFFKDERYLRALFPRIIGIKNNDTNPLLQIHEFDDVNFLRRKTRNLQTLNKFIVFNPQDILKQNYELYISVNHFDTAIKAPLVGIVQFEVLESSEPGIQHAINISQYFSLGSQTLVISYRLAIIKPLSWVIKNVLDYASSFLLKADKEDFISGARSASWLMSRE